MLRKLTSNILVVIAASFVLVGCGTTEKKQQAWYKVRNSEFSFQQAVSNCEDQLRKSSTDDSRFIAQIAGIQHPVFLICMMRNGFELRDL